MPSTWEVSNEADLSRSGAVRDIDACDARRLDAAVYQGSDNTFENFAGREELFTPEYYTTKRQVPLNTDRR